MSERELVVDDNRPVAGREPPDLCVLEAARSAFDGDVIAEGCEWRDLPEGQCRSTRRGRAVGARPPAPRPPTQELFLRIFP